MKWFIVGLLFSQCLWAENSKIVPVFLEASKIYVSHDEVSSAFILRPDIQAALEVLKQSHIDPALLEKYTEGKSLDWALRHDDKFDHWVKSPDKNGNEAPEMAVQALKIKVVEETDDWFKDDIYAYFFVTDGVIPTGKVTSIYKGLSAGQSFFFNEVDRAIFPLIGIPAKRPDNHLIIDYGIIESDGDDIKEMQKLSAIIIDIAIAVYASYDPQTAQVLMNLRKEIKALAEMLLSLNHDDRLATGTLGFKASELAEMLRESTYVELSKTHKGNGTFDRWEYILTFRVLRN